MTGWAAHRPQMLATSKLFFRSFGIGFALWILFAFAPAKAAGLDDKSVPASDSLWPGHVSFEMGYKRSYLGDGDANGLIGAGPVNQFAFTGFDFDIRRANWPVSLALQAQFAVGSGEFSDEAGVGLRKIWQLSQFEPFIGLGFTAASIGDVFNDGGTGYGGLWRSRRILEFQQALAYRVPRGLLLRTGKLHWDRPVQFFHPAGTTRERGRISSLNNVRVSLVSQNISTND